MKNRMVMMRAIYYNGTREDLKLAMDHIPGPEKNFTVTPISEKDQQGNIVRPEPLYTVVFEHQRLGGEKKVFTVTPGDIIVWGIYGEMYIVPQELTYKGHISNEKDK